MDFSEVTGLLKADLSRLEKAIRENYKSDIPLIPGIGDYLVNGGGKRMRPLLLLLSSKLFGAETDDRTIRHCCVVEYIHSATLLHDDVVDATTLRRGHETVNSKWGSDASILIGDYFLSRAILLLANDCEPKIIQAIAQTARTLVEGGILEFTNARKLDVTEELILDVMYRKTASIISVSCRLGALLTHADEESEELLTSFGDDFGMAFQLMDDVMDYDGTEELLGKPAGTDLKEGHVTLPLLHLYQNCDRRLRKEIEQFIKRPDLSQKELEYIIERLREAKSIEYTLDKARAYMDRAKKTVRNAKIQSPKYLEALLAVADYIIERHTAAKPCA
ncbi:MAG: polyprenyl synthetase family protein [Nitrospinae bacterium]|nr:polyprenyl synthetase family protein [Nitrospinota bacterium]